MKKIFLITTLTLATTALPILANGGKTEKVFKCDRFLGISLPGSCRYVDAPKQKNDTQPAKKPRRRGRRPSQRTSPQQCKVVNGTYDFGKNRCYFD